MACMISSDRANFSRRRGAALLLWRTAMELDSVRQASNSVRDRSLVGDDAPELRLLVGHEVQAIAGLDLPGHGWASKASRASPAAASPSPDGRGR